MPQLYRDRADAENGFDELKNQWGYFCPTHRKGKIGAIPEFRAHHLCLQGADPTLPSPRAICRLVQWAPADSMLFTEG
jgi:hypothetical protein